MTGGGCGRGRAPSCNQKGGLGERCKLPQPQPLYLFPYLLLTLNAEIDPVIMNLYTV